MDKEDKQNCFAWINEHTCNALTIKDCKNCNFYKDKKEVPNYSIYLKKGKKELLTNNENKKEVIK